MQGSREQGARVNSYAAVGYLDGPLGAFLDGVRRELELECQAKAHVTVLPPRPVQSPPEEAWDEAQSRLRDIAPIHVQLGDVRIFPGSMAIYLSIQSGSGELEQLHRVLSSGRLQFQEPFEYHPHVTLAKDLPLEAVSRAIELAERRWQEYSQPRSFVVDRLTFVQNTLENCWLDLAAVDLVGQTTTQRR